MKSEALTLTLIAAVTAVAVWLLAGVHVNLVNVDKYIAWAAAGALIAMVPVAYRSAWKRSSTR